MTELVASWFAWRPQRRGAVSLSPEPRPDPPHDWEELGEDVAKEVVRQAELNLQQQASVAQSIDQRATSMAGLANAGAVAVLVFLASQLATQIAASKAVDVPLISACLAVASAWWASAVMSYAAMAPAKWRSAGFWPSQLYRGLAGGPWTLAQRLGAIAEQLDDACRINDVRNKRAALRLRLALGLAGTAPIVGLFAWAAALKIAGLDFWAG